MLIPDNISSLSEKEQNILYDKIIKNGYSFKFEENGISIFKDKMPVYSFNTWVKDAPIISKLIWFGCYERYINHSMRKVNNGIS